MELETTNQSQFLQTSSAEAIKIAKAIYHVNQLTSFDLSDRKIIEWSQSIIEILPHIELDDLKLLIREMKTGSIAYDHRLGVQNIFIGLKTKFGSKYFPSQFNF